MLEGQGSVEVKPSDVSQEQQAPEGPPVSSRRFQPADNIAMRITSTPTGLIPQARDLAGADSVLLAHFRGLHPRLPMLCPFGAIAGLPLRPDRRL